MNNDEFLKYVMIGMGEQPSDNMLENYDRIMNYVPDISSGNNIPSQVGSSKVKLTFNYTTGGQEIVLDLPEQTTVKEALTKFARMANVSDQVLNKCSFLCDGKNYNIKTEGTLKSNNLKNGAQIVVINMN